MIALRNFEYRSTVVNQLEIKNKPVRLNRSGESLSGDFLDHLSE